MSLAFAPFDRRMVPNPSTGDVVQWMRRFAAQGAVDRDVRGLAEDVVQGVQRGDNASEALALYGWVCSKVRYCHDPNGVEYVRWPRETLGVEPRPSKWAAHPTQLLEVRCGDCDDIATALAALGQALGMQCSFVLAAFRVSGVPSHVFTRIETSKGPLVIDPVANVSTARMLRTMTSCMVVPCGAGRASGTALHGVPFRGWGGVQW